MRGTLLANRYLLAEMIGEGGMGTVFRATDLRTGGPVAVKVLHPYLARDPAYRSRLRREARIAASLTSSRVVRILDMDEHQGFPFLVMQYVPGPTLYELLDERGRLPPAEALTLALEVAHALQAGHAAGIVHRDLKPQNIKLHDGQVKVLDFGIARAEGMAAATFTSAYLGTPEYCAPERAAGQADIRSDIYSLGVILFELLEGALPYSGPTPLAIVRQHETAPVPWLSPGLPRRFQHVIDGCLAKDPAGRFQTPDQLIQALQAARRSLADGRGQAAGQPSQPGRPPGATPSSTNAQTWPAAAEVPPSRVLSTAPPPRAAGGAPLPAGGSPDLSRLTPSVPAAGRPVEPEGGTLPPRVWDPAPPSGAERWRSPAVLILAGVAVALLLTLIYLLLLLRDGGDGVLGAARVLGLVAGVTLSGGPATIPAG